MPHINTATEAFVQSGDADAVSDYGSDFTAEEESLLDGLIHAGLATDNPNQDPDIQLKTIEDDEIPQQIKIPRYPFLQASGHDNSQLTNLDLAHSIQDPSEHSIPEKGKYYNF